MNFMTIYAISGEIIKITVPSILAFFAWWQSRGNQKVIDEVKSKMSDAENNMSIAAKNIVKVDNGVKELRITVDGRLSQLLALTELSAFARGKLESDKMQSNIEGENKADANS